MSGKFGKRRGLSWYAYRAVVFIVVGLVFWASLSTLSDFARQFRANWRAESSRHAKAYQHIYNETSVCNEKQASLHVAVGEDFAGCEKARIVLQQWPALEAFHETLKMLEFCAGGKCLEFSVGLFGMFNIVAGGIIIGALFVVACIILKAGSFLWSNALSSNTLPLYMSPLHAASANKAEQHYCASERSEHKVD